MTAPDRLETAGGAVSYHSLERAAGAAALLSVQLGPQAGGACRGEEPLALLHAVCTDLAERVGERRA